MHRGAAYYNLARRCVEAAGRYFPWLVLFAGGTVVSWKWLVMPQGLAVIDKALEVYSPCLCQNLPLV